MRALVVLTFVISCSSGSKKPPEAPGPATASLLTCVQVADHVAKTVVADKPRPGATHATVKDLVSTRCQADAWTDETKRCLNAIATIRDGRACATQMTEDQRTALRTQARALRKDATQSAIDPDDHSSDWVRHVVEEPGTPTR
jgi:hypothetical protein